MLTDVELVSTPKRNALIEVTNATNYVSPNANLKLLTNVALHYPTPPPSTSAQRKEKSLQILCDRFLKMYPLNGKNNGKIEIHLDTTAITLGVEKRRMYDIINILEAMQCAVHRRKNTYQWNGATNLLSFLSVLKKQGEALKLSLALRGKAPKPPPPKFKTLGVLAQRFLMLFLVEPPNTLINLEMAVAVLIDTQDDKKMSLTTQQLDCQHKSKVRRLYDIANVLISIGLIEKVSGNLILKKPVFTYVGPSKLKRTKTPSPLTPVSIKRLSSTVLHNHLAKSKRKLDFSEDDESFPGTPSHKWDEILKVVDMEFNKLSKKY